MPINFNRSWAGTVLVRVGLFQPITGGDIRFDIAGA